MKISSELRNELQEKIPEANFAPYFDFLESLPLIGKGPGVHRHHILPKQEFPEQATNADNLVYLSTGDHFKAHYYLALCTPNFGPFQFIFFLMANRKASHVRKDQLPGYVQIYERGTKENARQSSLLGRITGPILGRKMVESGQLANIQSAGGKVMGRKNVENGHLASLRTPQHQRKAAKAAGRKAVETGQIQALARSGVGGRIGGRVAAKKNVASGQLDLARHIRWHVKRGVVNSRCKLCV